MLLSNIKNDQTRILMTVIREIVRDTNLNCKFGYNDPKVGDIVLCTTSGIHDYTVGEVTQVVSKYECFIRQLGGENVCRIHNESFMVLEVPETSKYLFLEGQKYQFLIKIKKIIQTHGDGYKLFSSVKFIDDVNADVFIRERWGVKGNPFAIRVCWNRKKITLKKLWEEIEPAYLAGKFL